MGTVSTVTDRQKKGCLNDIADFCKQYNLKQSLVALKLGLSEGYFSTAKHSGMSRRVYEDVYQFMEDYEAGLKPQTDIVTEGNFSLINAKLDELLKLMQPQEVYDYKIPQDCAELIKKSAQKFNVPEEDVLRVALGNYLGFQFKLIEKYGCDYKHPTQFLIPDIIKDRLEW